MYISRLSFFAVGAEERSQLPIRYAFALFVFIVKKLAKRGAFLSKVEDSFSKAYSHCAHFGTAGFAFSCTCVHLCVEVGNYPYLVSGTDSREVLRVAFLLIDPLIRQQSEKSKSVGPPRKI